MANITKRMFIRSVPLIATIAAFSKVKAQPPRQNGPAQPSEEAQGAREQIAPVRGQVTGSAMRKVLVAYASGFGTTAGIAEAIGMTLRDNGMLVDIKSVDQIDDVSTYDSVVIGSAIRYDKWMPEATEFVTKHGAELQSRPVAFFFACLTLASKSDGATLQAQGYADKLRDGFPNIHPVDVKGFAGALDISKFKIYLRPLVRAAFFFLGVGEGDYRQWNMIEAWANNLVQKQEWKA